ncbi:hypothetical protein BOX15_Mlig031192g1, partial [Macrostomum lignano]
EAKRKPIGNRNMQHRVGMHKLLVLLACLVAAATAQQQFYCSPDSPTIVSASLTDFYLTTRRKNEASYSSGMSCEFNAESPNRAFFVEVKSFKVSSAVFTISSGDEVLFSGSSIPDYQHKILTPSKSLRVRFDASGDQSNSEGVTVRVRAMDLNGCIPGWTYISGTCYGTDSIESSRNYFDAQRACNSMRSNLLHVPVAYYNNIGSFMRLLPNSLRRYYTWIGLTDRSARFSHYWLSRTLQFWTSEISCYSGGSSSSCYSYERCGTFNDKSSYYAIFMDDCSDRNKFACSAPPGGTSTFYTVPNTYNPYYSTSSNIWVYALVGGGLFLFGLIVVGIYSGMRSRARRRVQGASSVVVSAGQVTVPPPAGSYPAAPQYPAGSQPYPTQPQYPQAPQYPQYPQYTAAPPSYDAAVTASGSSGQVNAGFNK